jgi:glycerol-3-phosphate acyltransferase PlsY
VEWRPNLDGGSGSARSLGGMQQLSLVLTSATALTWLVDLAAVPSKRTVSLLAEGCACPSEAAKLRVMASEEGYKEKVCFVIVMHTVMHSCYLV